MTRRWRALLRPHDAPPPPVPGVREVLCAWALGLGWTLGCLWLAGASRPAALPILLLAGVLVMWGWSYMTWIAWFPGVLAMAATVQPFVPFAFRAGPEPVGITGTLALAVLMIATMRALAFRRPLFPGTPIDRPLLALALLIGVAVIPASLRDTALHSFKCLFIGVVTFYACTAVASLPGGALRLWPVFPLVLVAIPATAALHALGWIAPQDSELGRTAMLESLLVALPPSVGLALDAGHPRARRVWGIAVLVGLAALFLLAPGGFGPHDVESPFRLGAPLGFARATLVWMMLFALAAVALRVRRERRLEPARWIGLATAFIGTVGLELAGRPVDALPQIVMLATGAGIVTGSARAAARRARGGTVAAPAAGRAAASAEHEDGLAEAA